MFIRCSHPATRLNIYAGRAESTHRAGCWQGRGGNRAEHSHLGYHERHLQRCCAALNKRAVLLRRQRYAADGKIVVGSC